MEKEREILSALEASEKPSRDIDAMIAVAMDWKFKDHEEGDLTPRGMAEKHGIEWLIDRMKNSHAAMWRHIPEFTNSIDEATSLIESLIRCEFGKYSDMKDSWAYVNFRQNGTEYYGNSECHANHAMAILAAYFSALIHE